MLKVIIFFLIGCMAGFLMASLLAAASKADDSSEEMATKYKEDNTNDH